MNKSTWLRAGAIFPQSLLKVLAGIAICCAAASELQAVPNLQLGPGGQGDFYFDSGSETWIATSSPFELQAFAKYSTKNGPWDAEGQSDLYAYLVLAATPHYTGGDDVFDVNVTGSMGALTMVDSGVGNPPVEDPNSLSPHGVYDTYFELYEFQFDPTLVSIPNTSPGSNGTTLGYFEELMVTVNSLGEGVLGLHMDLFTISGDGRYQPGVEEDNKLVNAFAPYSHDAAFEGPPTEVPEPATWATLGGALLLLAARRKKLINA